MRSYADSPSTEPYYAKNPHILEWWTSDHDALLLEKIKQDHWIWYWSITEQICDITPSEIVVEWRERDPLCKTYAWYNVLMYFAIARAKELGYLEFVRKPKKNKCPVCGDDFSEDEIPPSVVRHLGINQIDICIKCIGGNFLQGTGNDNLSKEEIISWIRELSRETGIIPSQQFFGSLSQLTLLSTKERLVLVRLARRKPTIRRVKSLFGSWLHTLTEAGVLQDGTRETSYGTQSIAKDGHICLSIGEKTIDDYLFRNGITHEKEPVYPEGNYRADFKIGDYLVEYFGLAGDEGYDQKIEEKKRIAKIHGVNMICIFPKDLVSEKQLEKKLNPAMRKSGV